MRHRVARIALPGVFSSVLEASLALLPSTARGARVRFRLVVTNTSSHAVDLYLRGREPTLEVVIAHETGEVVWRSLDGVVIPAVLQLRTLAPGERLEVSSDWNQRVDGQLIAPGTYRIRASLLAEGNAIDAVIRGVLGPAA